MQCRGLCKIDVLLFSIKLQKAILQGNHESLRDSCQKDNGRGHQHQGPGTILAFFVRIYACFFQLSDSTVWFPLAFQWDLGLIHLPLFERQCNRHLWLQVWFSSWNRWLWKNKIRSFGDLLYWGQLGIDFGWECLMTEVD